MPIDRKIFLMEVRMPPVAVVPAIFWVGVNDHQTDLFEGLWPIKQEGVSYNSYLIRDEKSTLIELVKAPFADEYIQQIQSLIDLEKLSYIVLNHMEPDHTSALLALVQKAPQVKVLVSEKAQPIVASYYGLKDAVQVVKDGEEVSLGSHTLRFHYTPFVHWPETMMTTIPEEQILFSCDGFGGFGALDGILFDEQVVDMTWHISEALRYYSNIVAAVSKPVLNAIGKLSDLPIKVVAPSHGLIWKQNPLKIIQLYKKWAEYGSQPAEIGVTILCASMYGSTANLVPSIEAGLESAGVSYKRFDVIRDHPSYILPSLWMNRGVIVASPTYEGFLVPPMRNILDIATHKRIFNRIAAYTGSYTWGGGARRDIETFAEGLKWKLAASYDYPGFPHDPELKRAYQFGVDFAAQVLQE
jgi:flavorubredoxin